MMETERDEWVLPMEVDITSVEEGFDLMSSHVDAGHDVRMEWRVTVRSYGSIVRGEDGVLEVENVAEELGDTASDSEPWCVTCGVGAGELTVDEQVMEV